MSSVLVTRSVQIPDPIRVARSLRTPELGPRILFFSGGSALRAISRTLKLYTHNSIHLITPFDSGGSSAHLREAFAMLSVGDLRNRLMALADESIQGNPAIYSLFSHRFPQDESIATLQGWLEQMVRGEESLVVAIPQPMRQLIQHHLQLFVENMPAHFDLRGASIGNLILAGGYLNQSRDIDSVIFLFSRLVEVRGLVQPIVDVDLHLAAYLQDGSEVVGQHELTGKEGPMIESRVEELRLVSSLKQPVPAEVAVPEKVRNLIRSAEVLCYPIGSFYSSLIANLLPKGVGRAIQDTCCPKIYIPNMGKDPEQVGMRLSDTIETLLRHLQRDTGEGFSPSDFLHYVLVDSQHGRYEMELDRERVESLGVRLLDVPLVESKGDIHIDPLRLTEVLLSLA